MGAVPGVVRYSARAIVDAVIHAPRHLRRLQPLPIRIRNFGVPSFGDEYVGRLDISVSDSRRVGCIERVRNLNP